MKRTFVGICIILLLLGIMSMLCAEHFVDRDSLYPLYVSLVNVGAALLTIGAVSLVAQYVTLTELTRQFAFIHDRERTGIERTYDNWQECVSGVRFYDKLPAARDIVLVGYSHAKTLLVLDDEHLLDLMRNCRRLTVFIADGADYAEGVSPPRPHMTRSAMLDRFPVDSCSASVSRLTTLRGSLPVKHQKKVRLYIYHPETVNVLSVKLLDDIGLLRLVGLRQAGFSSPFIQFGRNGSLWSFVDGYVAHLATVSRKV